MHISIYEKKQFSRGTFGNAFGIVIIVIICMLMLLPVVYTVNNAFKPLEELTRFPPTFIVQNPTLKNFTDLFSFLNETTMPFMRYFFNTVFLTAVVSVLRIITSSLCAYSLAKIPFPGANVIFNIIVFSLMFSAAVTGTPNYIIMSKLGLIDTYAGMMLPQIASTMGFYLMKQFMHSNVPDQLLEAARIDGASELKVFFKIAMPLLKPAWFTLIILSIQGLWSTNSSNTYREVFKTLPEAFSQIGGSVERMGISAASALIMIIVPFTCFIFMQSKIVDTMSSAGLKG